MKDNRDTLKVLRSIDKKPNTTQRELASNLGYSIGKLNYCLSALKSKGFVKVNNFSVLLVHDLFKYKHGPKNNSTLHKFRNSFIMSILWFFNIAQNHVKPVLKRNFRQSYGHDFFSKLQ